MLELKVKNHIGYEFIQHCTVVNGAGEYCIVVLGKHKDGRLVTWETMDGESFYGGHYFSEGSFIEATRDMLKRASNWHWDVYQDPRKQLEEDGWFGIVMWSEDDLEAELEREEFPQTEHNLRVLKDCCERPLRELLVEYGWEVIDAAISTCTDELDRYDEDGNIVKATFEVYDKSSNEEE